MPNRLATEASPYLRDHAENPVDWYPWGEEALAKSRAEDKPIFLSVGYSSCHWCHVMAREAFSDAKIAAMLNESFVSIKVDREERPDLDEIYVEAVRLMTGTAGWPLSVFLTPELKPFYGGTYFPPEPRFGLAAFERVLASVLHYYRSERHEIDEASNRVTAELNQLSALEPHKGELADAPLRRFYEQRLEVFDSEHGGFGIAPKFPNPTDLSLLIRLARKPGYPQALSMVELTLKRMAEGGIYDQLGGGFHRYSTDTIWLVPHFEKMLYDNALLSRTCAQAFRLTGDDFYRTICRETLAYVECELGSREGGFYSSQDADAEGGEGSYYLWTPDQLREAVGPDLAPLAADFYGVTAPGNFDSRNVLHYSTPVEHLLQRHRLSLDRLWQQLEDIRLKMLAARARRPAPHRDEKILADWNGLALSAFAAAYRSFGDVHYLDVARAAAEYVVRELVEDGDLVHFARPGSTDVPGQLPDFALVAQGLLDLYEACFDVRHVELALKLTDRMVELFSDPDGGFFTTRTGTGLIARVRNGSDGALPSGNSVAVMNLLKLSRLAGRDGYERLASATLRRFYPVMLDYPSGFGKMLSCLDLLLNPGKEVVLFLPSPSATANEMSEAVKSRADDYLTVVGIYGAEPDEVTERLIPIARGRKAVDRLPTAYVCSQFTCHEPVNEVKALESLLDRPPGSLDTNTGQK
jgi:hypothetical protein